MTFSTDPPNPRHPLRFHRHRSKIARLIPPTSSTPPIPSLLPPHSLQKSNPISTPPPRISHNPRQKHQSHTPLHPRNAPPQEVLRCWFRVSWWGCVNRRESYEWVMRVLGLDPEECVMVMVHTNDLKGAREVFCRRWTDDINEDQEVIECKMMRIWRI
ncbi:uncharacterized protein EAE98_006778 [Botrytis deweyae]|uniref:Uncharacterized protein n=1 Tax=Botrytis deweyae TaxID=2478750 RepID=A0ABQ7IIP1_9HELO|nr:uncharacterized protein EAE98_006778 [Botrytis deweyae]KAF7925553.1 hypothetical protein EAE98_006778 [Botrytis deweyae]